MEHGPRTLTEYAAGDLKTPMLILLGAVAFVLLIACSNIAGLMLVRASGRARELAIRAALGASRIDLICQAFSETSLLSLFGTALGFIAALASCARSYRLRAFNYPQSFSFELMVTCWHLLPAPG